MHDLDGLNFECPSCGSFKYIQDENREEFLISRGGKRCLVCGNVAYLHGDVHTCLKCNVKMRIRFNPHERFEVYNRNGKGRPITIRFMLILAILLILLDSWALAFNARAASEAVDVEFNSDQRFSEVNQPINIGDAENTPSNQSTIQEWMSDLGTDMVNGTYWGTLFSPALFEHSLRASYWINGSAPFGQFTYVALSAHFIWSAQVIMSGASQWWLRLPIHPDSIDWNNGLELAIFKNETNPKNVSFERHYSARNIVARPTINGYLPDDLLYFQYNSSAFSSGNGKITSNHAYVEVNSLIFPGIDYVFAICFRIANGAKLKTYWSTCESPTGRNTAITIAETTYEQNSPYVDVDVLDIANVNVSLDLDWSCIFEEGIGLGGLFGKQMHFPINSTLNLYPFFNTSRSGSQYMSFMWPFISDEDVNVSVRVTNSVGLTPAFGYTWNFTNGDYEFRPFWCWTYHDFVLFSTSEILNWSEFNDDDRWNVWLEFTFNRATNLTLLCYAPERPRVLWSTLDADLSSNSSRNPFLRPWWSDRLNGLLFQQMCYEVYVSARGTNGQWAIRETTPSGRLTFSHHFPQEIHLSSAEWEFCRGDSNASANLTRAEIFWREAQEFWNQGHYFKAIYSAMKSVLYSIWDGTKNLIGKIKDGLSWVWEKMKEIGNWLYTHLVEFLGKIWDFLCNAYDTIAHFWDSFRYLVSPLLMMSIIVVGTRFTKLALRSWEGEG